MAIDLILSPDRPNNPFEQYRRTFLKALAAVTVPVIGSYPEPADFEAVRDHIREVTRLADQWLTSVGQEVASNATCHVKMDYFTSGFSDYGVNGWATFECDRAADVLREDIEAEFV